MFEKFATEVGKAHNQLMEGAITYHEFFNFCAMRVHEVMTAPTYVAEAEAADAEFSQDCEHGYFKGEGCRGCDPDGFGSGF